MKTRALSCLLTVSILLTAGLALARPAAADVRINDPGLNVGKPSLAAGPGGTLYAAVEDLSLQWFYVYQSINRGASWTYLTGVVGGPAGFDTSHPSIACGEDYGGRMWVYVAYETREPDGRKSVDVLRFDPSDVGTADIRTIESGITIDDEIHPEICTDSPPFVGNFSVYITYNRKGGIDPAYQVLFSRSDDHGETWLAPQVIASPAPETNQRPHIAFGGPLGFPGDAFRLFVVYEGAQYVAPTWRNNIFVRVSRYYGSSWDPPVQLTSSTDDEYDARVAAAEYSTSAVVVYTRNWQNSGDLDIRYAYSTNAGVNWVADGWIAGSTEVEETANIGIIFDNRFHCAFWKGWDILYTWTDDAGPTGWASTAILNDTHTASNVYPRPAVCAMRDVPEAQEGAVAWTDFRNGLNDAYFDAPGGSSGVESPPEMRSGPLSIELGRPYPNPGPRDGTVFLPLRLGRDATVSLELYDVQGRRLAVRPPQRLGAGAHVVPWWLERLVSGAYFVRVVTDRGPTAATRWLTVE